LGNDRLETRGKKERKKKRKVVDGIMIEWVTPNVVPQASDGRLKTGLLS